MKNCAGTVMIFTLRSWTSASIIKYVDPSVDDYCVRAITTQGDHRGCHHESRCHKPGYIPKRQLLSNPAAIKALEGALKKTSIYRFADHFCRVRQPFLMLSVPSCASSSVIQCRDTYWIESFNHQLLTYLPKRIHFGNDTFVMRMNLAVLDWVSSGDKKAFIVLTCHCVFRTRMCKELPQVIGYTLIPGDQIIVHHLVCLFQRLLSLSKTSGTPL